MNGPLLLKLDSVQEYNKTHMQVQQWKKDHVLFSIRSNNGVPFIMASLINGIIQIHSQVGMTRPSFEIWKAGLVFENGIFCGSDYMDRENGRIYMIHSFHE